MSIFLDKGEKFKRQTDFVAPEIFDNVTFHIVGCGGIGSVAAIALAKIGAQNFCLYDDDTIELHNIPNQFLTANEDRIGRPKVADLAGNIKRFGGQEIDVKAYQIKIDDQTGFQLDKEGSNVIIVGPDNMEARHICWDKAKKLKDFVKFIVDGRMASKMFRVYTAVPGIAESENFYEQYLHDDSETEELPCSDRAVFHTNLILAGVICESVRRALQEHRIYKEVIFDLINMRMQKL